MPQQQTIYGGDFGIIAANAPVAAVATSAALSPGGISLLNATSASVIGTLPAAALKGTLWVYRSDDTTGHTATVAAAEGGSVLINGVASFTIAPEVGYFLVSNGTAWTAVAIGTSPSVYGKFTSSTSSTVQVAIPHGLGVIPSFVSVQSANTATAQPANVTADITNVYANYAAALTTATAYAWWYQAKV